MLAAAALAVSAAGCAGGDDGDTGGGAPPAKATPGGGSQSSATPAEREAVRAAVVRLFKSQDVHVICERSLTPRLFRLIFAGPAACRKASAEDEDDEPPKRVEVSEIETGGKRATARASLIGGDSAGATGVVSLAKGNEGWRTDDLSTGFLRSLLEASLRTDRETPRVVVRCVNGRLTDMPRDQFKRLVYSLIGNKPRATARLLEALSECERRRGGISSIRRPLEKQLTKTLRQGGADPKEIACALRRLRVTVPDKLIIDLAAYKRRRLKQRIAREVVAAAIACGTQRPADPGELSPA